MIIKIRACIRIVFLVFGLFLTSILVLACSAIPFRHKNARLAAWLLIPIGHYFNWVCGVKFVCKNPEIMRQHKGLLFANHTSYADIPSIISAVPGRFVTAIEVRRRPVLGWVAAGLDSIFIDRQDKSKGRGVSTQIANAILEAPFPPVIIFPEGKLGPGDKLLNFQRGSFRIAVKHQIPYLLCAIRYNRPDIFTWHGGKGESMTAALWRLAQHNGPLSVELIPVEVVHPKEGDNPVELAKEANRKIAQALGF